MKFIFDTGASDVSISSTEASFLIKNGYLKPEDIIGKQKYRIANGDIEEGTIIILREIKIGTLVLHDVKAGIVKNANAPLLLGITAISKLGKVSIEGDKIIITAAKNEDEKIEKAIHISDARLAELIPLFKDLINSKGKDSTILYKYYKFYQRNEKSNNITLTKKDSINVARQYIDYAIGVLRMNFKADDIDIKKIDFETITCNFVDTKKIFVSFLYDDNEFGFYNAFEHFDSSIILSENTVIQSLRSNSNKNINNPMSFSKPIYTKRIWNYFNSIDSVWKLEEKYINVINFCENDTTLLKYDEKYLELESNFGNHYPNHDLGYYCYWYACELVRAERYQDAINILDKIPETSDFFESSFELKGKCLLNIKKYSDAIQAFKKAIKFKQEDIKNSSDKIYVESSISEIYNYIGKCKWHLDDYLGAIEDFDKVKTPDYNVYYLRGLCKHLYADNNSSNTYFDAALIDYNLAIKDNPDYCYAYLNRGNLKYFHLHNILSASKDWSKAGELGCEEAYEQIKLNINKSKTH